ncbi:hypothetical protein NMG60_11036191 [Bertholletia excelsa]
MSTAGISNSDKSHKKSLHRRNDSGELDVFEAARYFAGASEVTGYKGPTFTVREDGLRGYKGGRMSLDVPLRDLLPSHTHLPEKPMKEKKYKQPSSPGGRLASFLNSLFHQASSKKKKSKSITKSLKEEDESPGGWRKRRSSVSYFPSSSTADSKSVYSSSSSGFRTPPPYAHTPTKAYKDLRSHSDIKHVLPQNGQVKATALQNTAARKSTDCARLNEQCKFTNALLEKPKNSENNWIWEEEKEDAYAESDSSSDLFELENYDLGYYSSGLPVYETTHIDSIKRGTPISNGAM